MSIETDRDPRSVLVREKFFSIRPKPLERWLWAQGVPPAAERVFWLHWQEGQQRGDWCSELPIKRVAQECQLDVSTVTRAYQVLQKMGCLRRADPGRDPSNPFQQATAVTEVRVPRELLVELNRHPNRRSLAPQKRLVAATPDAPPQRTEAAESQVSEPSDPFEGLRGRERQKAFAELTQGMSPAENQAYQEALRWHRAHMSFDPDTRLSAQARGKVLGVLRALAAQPVAKTPVIAHPPVGVPQGPRKLSVFEVARLKYNIQSLTTSTAAQELTRQVLWSMEEGALKRFSVMHAIHIALKKIRAGQWTRPNRMPPNWARAIGAASGLETCRRA